MTIYDRVLRDDRARFLLMLSSGNAAADDFTMPMPTINQNFARDTLASRRGRQIRLFDDIIYGIHFCIPPLRVGTATLLIKMQAGCVSSARRAASSRDYFFFSTRRNGYRLRDAAYASGAGHDESSALHVLASLARAVIYYEDI